MDDGIPKGIQSSSASARVMMKPLPCETRRSWAIARRIARRSASAFLSFFNLSVGVISCLRERWMRNDPSRADATGDGNPEKPNSCWSPRAASARVHLASITENHHPDRPSEAQLQRHQHPRSAWSPIPSSLLTNHHYIDDDERRELMNRRRIIINQSFPAGSCSGTTRHAPGRVPHPIRIVFVCTLCGWGAGPEGVQSTPGEAGCVAGNYRPERLSAARRRGYSGCLTQRDRAEDTHRSCPSLRDRATWRKDRPDRRPPKGL